MNIQLGPDLSVLIIEGNVATYAGHLFTLKQSDPELFKRLTKEHFAEAIEHYPELQPAITDFLFQEKPFRDPAVPSPVASRAKPQPK